MVKETPAGYPTWVDKFYFNDILRKEYDQFKVVRFNVEHLNGKGENYASLMFRVKLTVENTKTGLSAKSYVVKTVLQSGMAPEIMEIFNVFPKEIQMYTEFLPKFEEMFEAVGETVRFGPKCLVGTRDPADLIIMEDLNKSGFRSANRMVGLDMEHTQLVITRLAKLHAASAVYIDKGNSFGEKFKNGIYSDHMRPIMESIGKNNRAIMKECSDQWKCAGILNKVDLHSVMSNRLFDLAKKDDSRFNVLCHGDMWCNNMMFKYDEDTQKLEDCLLVDFQMCHYNSPMLDLHYFIYTSTQHDVKLTKVDHILHFYHQQLVTSLKKLGYSAQMPTLLQLQKDFLELGLFGVSAALGTFAIAVAPGGDDSELESFMKNDESGNNFKRRVFSNPIFVKAIEDLVPYFEVKGFLEG